jgi:hypothetical protein
MLCNLRSSIVATGILLSMGLGFFIIAPPSHAENKELSMDSSKTDAILIQLIEAIPSWEDSVVTISKSEAELTEEVTQMLAQVLLNLGQGKNLAKSARSASSETIRNLRYTQSKFKITIARAALTRAASAALRQKVDESLVLAILELGKNLDAVLETMHTPGETP